MIEERYELAMERIRKIRFEETVKSPFRKYFQKMAEFAVLIDAVREELLKGEYQKAGLAELAEWNKRLYQDILPGQYETSYANPSYAVEQLGEEFGRILSFLYTELRGAIA